MEIPLDTLPALACIKDLHFWVVLNKNSEPMSWTDDAVEIAWLSIWVAKGRDAESKSVFAKTTTRPSQSFFSAPSSCVIAESKCLWVVIVVLVVLDCVDEAERQGQGGFFGDSEQA